MSNIRPFDPEDRHVGFFRRPPGSGPNYDPVSIEAVRARRRRTLEQQQDLVQRSIREGFRRSEITIEDTFGDRCWAAWRYTRWLLTSRGSLAVDESLSEARTLRPVNLEEDPWSDPYPFDPEDVGFFQRLRSPKAIRGFVEANALPRNLWTRTRSGEMQGLGILPPDPPAAYITAEGEVPDSYRPEHDELLRCWLTVFDGIAHTLRFGHGSPETPELGQYGCKILQNPRYVRTTFPSPQQIELYEHFIVNQALAILTAESSVSAYQILNAKWGLNKTEIDSVVRLARRAARDMADITLEDARAMLSIRLEDFAARSRTAGSLQGEIQAIKALAQVHGVTRDDQEGKGFDELVEVIKEKSAQRTLDRHGGGYPALP